jgi:hypothetical protein
MVSISTWPPMMARFSTIEARAGAALTGGTRKSPLDPRADFL